MIAVLKECIPGSLSFLLLSMGAVTGLLWVRSARVQRRARVCLVVLIATYWFLSVPMGADLAAKLVAWGYGPLRTAADAGGAGAVVVLDGGTVRYRANGAAADLVNRPGAFRAIEGARVYHLLGDPLVFVTGGTYGEQSVSSPEGGALRDELVRLGVPPARIVLDTTSRNTREHATTLVPLLRQRGIARIVLVTSLTHIRRATEAFEVEGVDVVPSAAAAHSEDRNWRWTKWRPSPVARQVSEDAIRDAIGIVYYWLRGWV